MDSVRDPRPELESLVPYDAKEIKADVRLASNEHPGNLPHELLEWFAERLDRFDFNRYPDPLASDLRKLIAEANGLEPGNILVGNGGDEIIFNLLLAWGGPGRTLIDTPPMFAGLIIISILGLGLFGLISLFEGLLVPWQKPALSLAR